MTPEQKELCEKISKLLEDFENENSTTVGCEIMFVIKNELGRWDKYSYNGEAFTE